MNTGGSFLLEIFELLSYSMKFEFSSILVVFDSCLIALCIRCWFPGIQLLHVACRLYSLEQKDRAVASSADRARNVQVRKNIGKAARMSAERRHTKSS